MPFALLGESRYFLVSVLHSIFVVSEICFRCGSYNVPSLDDASLPLLPCLTKTELDFVFSFYWRLSLLSLSLNPLDVSFPSGQRNSVWLGSHRSSCLSDDSFLNLSLDCREWPGYDLLTSPPPGRKRNSFLPGFHTIVSGGLVFRLSFHVLP